MDYIYKFLKKKRLLFVDNRLFFYVCATAFMVLGYPEAVEYATELETEAQGLVVAIGQAGEIILGMMTLLHSWGVRPPSGLLGDTGAQLIDAAREAGMDV